jgi:hypothetical protein
VSLRKRLDRLETSYRGPYVSNPELEKFIRELENLLREEAGLGRLPYTEEDRKEDEKILREVIPHYRESLGWQSEEAQQRLDEWERDVRKWLSIAPRDEEGD